MVFDSPVLLVFAPLFGLLVGLAAWVARRRRLSRAAAWSDEVYAAARSSGRWSPPLLGCAALVAGVALAGPRGGRAQVQAESRALNVVLAIDISRSMLAEDTKPNRLQRAVREARRLVQDLGGDRVGLIAFAGRSYILTPITVDGGAISLFFDGLSPDLASQGGTGLASALAQGGQLLAGAGETADRVLIVFSDGETHDSLPQVLAEAEQLHQLGVRLVLVAEGDITPVRIPVRDSAGTLLEYQQEESGAVIETRRRDDILQAVADAAEGALIPAQLPDQAGAVRDLVAAFKRSPSTETRTADLLPLGWIPMLLALALLSLQTSTRRTAALISLALVLSPIRAVAQRPSSGARALAAGKPAQALAEFTAELERTSSDTEYYNVGTAAILAGQPAVARKALTRAANTLDPDLRYRALYNLGVNALTAAGSDSAHRSELLEEAAGHLQQALTLQPSSRRAKWNLELARRLAPPPPPQGGGGGQGQPPPSQGQPPPKGGGGAAAADLSASQAEQILNSVDREERNTRTKHLGRARPTAPVVKDW